MIPGRCYGDPRSAIVRSSFLKYHHQARLITSASLLSKTKSNMKKETINKIVNFIVTVLTAALSTFFMQSCVIG